MNKSRVTPAFQFYPDEWLSSKNINLMTPAEEGGYIRLLCYEWNDPHCTLPDDDTELASLSRLGEAWHQGSGDRIRKCFEARNGRLRSDRLYRERRKQIQNRREKSAAGVKGAAAKRQKKRAQNPTDSKHTLDSAISKRSTDASSSIPITITTTVGEPPVSPPTDPPCSVSAGAEHTQKTPRVSSKPKTILTPDQETWHARIWPVYWRHDAKQAGRKAFGQHVTSREIANAVWAGIKRNAERMLGREVESRPQFATWINQHRWEDEQDLDVALVPANGKPVDRESARDQKQEEWFNRLMAREIEKNAIQ